MSDVLNEIVMGRRRFTSAEERGVWLRLLKDYVRPHWGLFAGAIFLMVIVAASTTYTTFLLGPAVEAMFPTETGGSMASAVPGLDWIMSGAGGVTPGDATALQAAPDPQAAQFRAILWIAGIAAVVLLIQALAGYGHVILVTIAGQHIVARLQEELHAHILDFDLKRLGATNSGRLISSLMSDTNAIRNSVSKVITQVFSNGLTAIGLIGVLIYTHWRIALIATVILPILALFLARLAKQLRKLTQKRLVEAGTQTALMSENLDGIRTVKAYGQEAREVGRMRASIARRREYEIKTQKVQQLAGPLTEALSALAVPAIIVYGGYESVYGNLTAGAFVIIIAAALRAYAPLKALSRLQLQLTEGVTAASRVFAILDEPPGIEDAPDARPLKRGEGAIRFRDVRFSYSGEVAALDGISLDIPAGTRAALVGPSGAGKTTILNLIPRFYDVDCGAIEIDSQDVRAVTMESLRASLSLVTQDPFLFDDSVRANIAYSRESASEDEIIAAARAANAHEFIMELPQGYDSQVGEQGDRLSGGQRQRIAIARAMLKDAPILLLDEATSALDSESERMVQAALAQLMQNRTSIVIAHRLSTVMDADVIFVIDRGRVVEQGRHDELIAADRLYARLYRTQFAVDEPARALGVSPGEPVAAK